MVNPNRFYTYAYLREDRTPYYIGKGEGNRVYVRSKKCIKPPKDKSRIIFLKQNLTEEDAFKHEIYIIAVFGRIDSGTGILHNRTDGGEGKSGWVASEETRRKMSESGKVKIFSEEHRRKMTEATQSKETRKKMSEAKKGKSLMTNSQKWECCETGYVSTAAGVVSYQKGKGMDTSKSNRKQISTTT